MPPTPKTRWRSFRWQHIALLLVVAIVVWWNWPRPSVLRLAHSYAYEHTIVEYGDFSLTSFYLDMTQPTTVTMLGLDGRIRWRVTIPICDYQSLSENGHYLVAGSDNGKSLTIMRWHGGQPQKNIQIPISLKYTKQSHQNLQLMVTNTGQIWVSHYLLHGIQLWVIDGMQIATCNYNSSLPCDGKRRFYGALSADGGTLIACLDGWLNTKKQIEYIRLHVSGAQVQAVRRYQATLNDASFHICDGGWVIVQNGTVYGPNGRVHAPDGWDFMYRNFGTRRFAPASHECVLQSVNGCYRILNPQKRFVWNIPTPKNVYSFPVCFSPDGRLAVMCEFNRATAERLNFLFDSLSVRVPLRSFNFSLYASPGRLVSRARLCQRLSDAPFGRETWNTPIQKGYLLSPDGRHLWMVTLRDNAEGCKFLHFLW